MALATAKRVGELRVLSLVTATQGEDLILSYLPEFVAKTETSLNPITRDSIFAVSFLLWDMRMRNVYFVQ